MLREIGLGSGEPEETAVRCRVGLRRSRPHGLSKKWQHSVDALGSDGWANSVEEGPLPASFKYFAVSPQGLRHMNSITRSTILHGSQLEGLRSLGAGEVRW